MDYIYQSPVTSPPALVLPRNSPASLHPFSLHPQSGCRIFVAGWISSSNYLSPFAAADWSARQRNAPRGTPTLRG